VVHKQPSLIEIVPPVVHKRDAPQKMSWWHAYPVITHDPDL
jgi:hypothetical protein